MAPDLPGFASAGMVTDPEYLKARNSIGPRLWSTATWWPPSIGSWTEPWHVHGIEIVLGLPYAEIDPVQAQSEAHGLRLVPRSTGQSNINSIIEQSSSKAPVGVRALS